MTTLHPLILACCAREDGIYAIGKPFAVDGMVYATDGYIIARMRGECDPNNGNLPTINSMPWDRSLYADEPLEIPDFAPFGGERPCEKCNGAKTMTCDCCGLTVQCDCCMGDGVVDEKRQPVSLGVVNVSNKYLTLLMKHGARLYAPQTPATATHPLYFATSDGVEGLLMPMA